MIVDKIAPIYNLLRQGKVSCLPCRLVWGLGGRRGNGIKIYRETDRYLLIDDLPQNLHDDAEAHVIGFLKRHTKTPTAVEQYMVEKALTDLAFGHFHRKAGEFMVFVSGGHFPDHWHAHVVIFKRAKG